MSFGVAVQSAIFYFAACTPCVAARARKRTKEKAKRDRDERARHDADDPDAYRHPIPFHHNPYWEEEMTLGPSLPKKGSKGSKNDSQRHLTSAGQDSNGAATRSSLAISGNNVPTPGGDKMLLPGKEDVGQRPDASPSIHQPNDGASFDLVYSTTTGSSMDGWNHKRYQREDEELWGSQLSQTGHKLMDAIKNAGTSAGRLLESTLAMNTGCSNANDTHPYSMKERHVTDEGRKRFYQTPVIHPPVNDYHPPIASSKPAHSDALRWMLQPPPPAKVMEGKIPPVSRSTSIASSYSRRKGPGASDASLGRAMSASQRQLAMTRSRSTSLGQGDGAVDAEKLAPSPVLLSRPTSRRTATARSKSHKSVGSARSGNVSTDEEGEDVAEWSSGSPGSGGKRRRRRTIPAPLGIRSQKDAEVQPEEKKDTHVAQRPRLETILSSDASASVISDGKTENLAAAVAKASHVQGPQPNPPSHRLIKPRPTGDSVDSGLALSS